MQNVGESIVISQVAWTFRREELALILAYSRLPCHDYDRKNPDYSVIWHSPPFRCKENEDLLWCIQLRGVRNSKMKDHHVKAYLMLEKSEDIEMINVDYQIELKDSDDEPYSVASFTPYVGNSASITMDTNCQNTFCFIDALFFLKCIKLYYSSEGTLRLGCTISTKPKEKDFLYFHNDQPDFEKLLHTSELSDFSLLVDGVQIKVHKCILAAKSPVFSAMFRNEGMVECKAGMAEIQGFDKKVFFEVLRYIYGGKIGNIKKIVRELLYAAEQYMLDDLKEKCLKCLSHNLRIENAIKVLILADDFKAPKLKSKVLFFIAKNLHYVLDTEDYKNLDRMELVKDISRCAAYKIL